MFLAVLALSTVALIPTEVKAYDYNNGNYYYPCCGYVYGNGYGNGNYGGYGNNNNLNPAPMVYQVSPSIVPAHINGNIVVTLTGGNFIPTSLAEFNNSYRPTGFIDESHLSVTLNPSDLETIGSYVITVFNPMPGGGNSNGVAFNINSGMLNNNNGNTGALTIHNVTLPAIKVVKTQTATPANTSATTQALNNSYSTLTANAIFGTNGFFPSSLIQWLLFAIMITIIIILTRKFFGPAEKYHNEPLKHA